MAREADRTGGPEDHATREDRDEMKSRPDEPTPSDDATLVERSSGAHAEYVDAPTTPGDGSLPGETEDVDEDEDRQA